ncbi:MAG: ROK family protein [Gemmatimonadales bacterium]|nr:MAG: ROK family protein [Gemmatimonadales bacterium]
MELTSPPHPPAPAHEARGRPLPELALETIWYRRRISRADLSRLLEVSRSTASELVSDLLATKLVAEVGDGPSRGGRRPILLEFQDEAHLILGVDMGATHVAVALTNLRGRVLAWREEAHPVRSDPDGTRELIVRLCEACLADVPGASEALLGLGVAVPAPVDHRDPKRLSPTVLPAWEGRSGFESLETHFGVPVFMDNDANLGAVAERWWGAGRGIEDFTYIKLATGIGAGLMVGGEVYRGATNAAGEIGHVSIDPKGLPCVCGNRGCLVTFVGGEALVRRAREGLAGAPGSMLSGCEITTGIIERAALARDPLAMQVVREAAHHLGVAIAGLLNLLNPGAVILGGSLARLGDDLLLPLRETVLRRTLVSSVAASEIRVSELGPRGIAIGASTLVLASALERPSLFPTMRD